VSLRNIPEPLEKLGGGGCIYPALTREIFLPRDHLVQRHSVRVAESFVRSCYSLSRSKLVSYCSYTDPCTEFTSQSLDPDFPLYIRLLSRRVQAFTVLCQYAALGDVYLLCCVVIHMEYSVVDVISKEEAVFLFVYSFPIGPPIKVHNTLGGSLASRSTVSDTLFSCLA
jgi:hypothetical protein